MRHVTRYMPILFIPAGDGVYAIQDGRSIQLVDLKENSTSSLVATSDIKDVRTSYVVCLQ